MAKKKNVEKWVLLRGLHLGFARESFGAGTVLTHDLDLDILLVDGRKFDSTKDLDILKAHEWIRPYSQEAVDMVKEVQPPRQEPRVKIVREKKAAEDIPGGEDREHGGMKVVKSDEDLMDVRIDIRHTKPKMKEELDREAPLEVIRGDETPEERRVRLKQEAPGERLTRLQSEIPSMPIVQDDSLGEVVGGTTPALNVGQVHTRTAEEVDKLRADANQKIDELPKKRKRGRPRKNPVEAADKPKRKRGRPRKNPVESQPKSASSEPQEQQEQSVQPEKQELQESQEPQEQQE